MRLAFQPDLCSDDKVEENHLASAFDITCQAWQVRAA